MPSLWHYIRRAPAKLRKMYFAERVERLEFGSGDVPRVRDGLAFRDVGAIAAERFIELLHYADAMYFLRECRRVLRDDGVLRISTPDLDVVWATRYSSRDAFDANRAFRGSGQQFLYNFEALQATLHDAGFAQVVRVDAGDMLVVEASGRDGAPPESLKEPKSLYLRDVSR